MNNIRYSINEIIRKPIICLMIVGQVLIGTMILIEALSTTLETLDTINKTKNLFNNKEVYRLVDNTNANKMMEIYSNKNIDNTYKLYSFLKSNKKFISLSAQDSNMLIENFTENEEFYYSMKEEEKYYIDPIENVKGKFSNIKSYYIDSGYLNEFPLSLEKGRTFKNEDFEEKNMTPIILGSKYKNIYKIGDEFRYFDYLSLKERKAKVIGILSENSYFFSSVGVVDLEDRVICPMSNITLENATLDKIQYWFTGCMVITNNKKGAITDIRSESSKLKLNDFKLSSCKEQINIVINELSKSFKASITLSGVIFLFISIGIITVQLNSIKEREEEHGIHLLSGASKGDIAKRYIYSTVIQIGVGMLLGTYFQYFKNRDTYGLYYYNRILIILIIVFCFIVLIIAYIPYRKIKKLEINTILRRLSE